MTNGHFTKTVEERNEMKMLPMNLLKLESWDSCVK